MGDSFQDMPRWNDSTLVNDHLCRICFSLTDLLIPIFEEEGIKEELHKKVEKYLPIKILPSDTLPQKICYPCAKILGAWDSLYIKCLKADEVLHLMFKEKIQPEAKEEEVEFDKRVSRKRKLTYLKERISKSSSSQQTSVPSEKPAVKKVKKVRNTSEKNFKMNEGGEEEIIEKNFKINEGGEEIIKKNLKCEAEIQTECNEDLGLNESDGNKSNNDSGAQYSCPVNCKFCSKSFRSKKCLKRHIEKFHEEVKKFKAQKCNLCSNVYKTKANFERHYLKEHLTDQEACPVCHVSFNSKKLDLHLKSAHGVKTEGEGEEKFKCKMCEKWFKNKYVRNSHMKDVHLSEPMKCKLCDFEGVQTVLKRHKRDVHGEKKFMCSLCPGAFKTLHTLKMHMTSHSDIRCYTCDICGMGFKRLNNVRDHMKCHEEKSNQCQICGNFFARKRYLAIHEKTIHNFYADGVVPEERGFECGTCGAKLKWKKNLLAHMRIHTGEKPYVCKICNKDFICHGSLRTHMAKHSVCTSNGGEPQNQASVSVFSTINNK